MEYFKETPPSNVALLPKYLDNEFNKLQQFVSTGRQILKLETLHVAPTKPEEGDVVFADGTNWNPGSGRGHYGYDGTTWNKLG